MSSCCVCSCSCFSDCQPPVNLYLFNSSSFSSSSPSSSPFPSLYTADDWLSQHFPSLVVDSSSSSSIASTASPLGIHAHNLPPAASTVEATASVWHVLGTSSSRLHSQPLPSALASNLTREMLNKLITPEFKTELKQVHKKKKTNQREERNGRHRLRRNSNEPQLRDDTSEASNLSHCSYWFINFIVVICFIFSAFIIIVLLFIFCSLVVTGLFLFAYMCRHSQTARRKSSSRNW